jgi:hypothetical protein
MPAKIECHLIKPIAKSTTAQIEKKSKGDWDGSSHQHYAPTPHNIGMIVVIRWDEKAGLQTGCCTLPSYRRARSTDKQGDRQ